MKISRMIGTVALLACVVGAGVGASGVGRGAAAPSVEGTYELTYRELPDGKQVRAPEILGLMTFTKDRRIFNVYWTENGKATSISVISKYKLTEKDYTEDNIYYMISDAIAGKPITYDTSTAGAESAVTVTGETFRFKLPLHNEPEVAFDKAGFTATRAGAFVDHWKKVQ